jgi:hypothetical protein
MKIKIENNSILEHCAQNNTVQFNFNKALEESAEFSEALLKFQTKIEHNPKRPTKQDILGEYGDFIYRGLIALKTLFPNVELKDLIEDVETHIKNKLSKLEEWKTSGKYKNGL